MELCADTSIFRYKAHINSDGSVELEFQDPENFSSFDVPETKPLLTVMKGHGHDNEDYNVRAEFIAETDTVVIYVDKVRKKFGAVPL